MLYLRPQRLRPGAREAVGKWQHSHEMNMADTRLLDEIDRKLKDILARSPAADLERNLRVLLASGFSRLDLVTREEFDAQREVLARTRAKLAELEAKLAELERTGGREIGRS